MKRFKMTKDDAIKLYLKYNKRAEKTIDYLIKWDNKKTIRENSVLLLTSKSSANQLKKMYKLSSAPGQHGGRRK